MPDPSPIIERDADAYRVAGVIVGFGTLIKIGAGIGAVLLVLVGAGQGGVLAFAAIAFALMIGLIGWAAGVLVSPKAKSCERP